MSKDRLPEDETGHWHGYCVDHYDGGKLFWKGVCVHGNDYGYVKFYNEDGSIMKDEAGYFLDGDRLSSDNEEGYCYIWSKVIV